MDRGIVGIVALYVISVSSALAAITAAVVFQIIGYLVVGHLDPFFIVTTIVAGVAALIFGFVVGIPVFYVKKKQRKEKS